MGKSANNRTNSKFTRIIDNRDGNIAGVYLKECLQPKSLFKFVSAYFTIYGFKEMKKELNAAKEVKFLYGDETNIEGTDPEGKEDNNFILDEENRLLAASEKFKEEVGEAEQLKMKPEARECIEWLKKSTVKVRGIKESNLLHGKLYITQEGGGNGKELKRNAMVGSSNFTKRGLGFGKGSNYEINLAVEGDECEQYEEWFDALWKNKDLVEDIKKKVIAELEKLKQDQSPEFIYYKTLYEIFKDRLEEDKKNEELNEKIDFKKTGIYKALYEFQRIAVTGILHRLEEHNGCILADSVGLGKTYTALAVIKHYELRGKKVLVLCPKKLRNNWALYKASTGSKNNPLEDDNFLYDLLNHTDLSVVDEYDNLKGKHGDFKLSNLQLDKYDLIVIDESHNFRNDTPGSVPLKNNPDIRKKTRYEHLIEDFIKSGKNSQVLMLSATPVNNSLIDLRNQIYLMCGKNETHFIEKLGIPEIKPFFTKTQRSYSEWTKKKPKDRGRLDKALGDEFLRLLDEISISRARDHIEKYYNTDGMQEFPKREKPKSRNPRTDRDDKVKYDELYKEIENFNLSVYSPAQYLKKNTDIYKQLEDKKNNFRQTSREKNLIHMMRINMLKRLESSAYSFVVTLQNIIKTIDNKIDLIDKFEEGTHRNQQVHKDDKDLMDEFEDEGSEDDREEMLAGAGQLKRIFLKDMDLKIWRKAMEDDRKVLEKIAKKVEVVVKDRNRDTKLEELLKDIHNKIDSPTKDREGKPCRKLLIFTSFADTASYLYKNLLEEVTKKGVNIGLVTGTKYDSSIGANDFDEILTHFSPKSKAGIVKKGQEERILPKEEIDILIATDCISEGQNLQDCDTVISYDIHWNPVRIIQRFGRVDRIGSNYKKVKMINYWPTKDLDLYINLKKRIEDKMALVDATATNKDNILEAQEEKHTEDLFREQTNNDLRALHEGVEDFDKIVEDEFSMQIFTLEDFRAQLLQYIAQNEARLRNAPNGLFAVTDTKLGLDSATGKKKDVPGYIFCLKQKDLSKDANKHGAGLRSNHIYPYFLIYMKKDAIELYGYRNVKDILTSFSRIAFGKNTPHKELCERFDKETNRGKKLDHIEKAIETAIKNTLKVIEDINLGGLGKGGGRSTSPNKPKELPKNFELITWLVVY